MLLFGYKEQQGGFSTDPRDTLSGGRGGKAHQERDRTPRRRTWSASCTTGRRRRQEMLVIQESGRDDSAEPRAHRHRALRAGEMQGGLCTAPPEPGLQALRDDTCPLTFRLASLLTWLQTQGQTSSWGLGARELPGS